MVVLFIWLWNPLFFLTQSRALDFPLYIEPCRQKTGLHGFQPISNTNRPYWLHRLAKAIKFYSDFKRRVKNIQTVNNKGADHTACAKAQALISTLFVRIGIKQVFSWQDFFSRETTLGWFWWSIFCTILIFFCCCCNIWPSAWCEDYIPLARGAT